MRLAEWRKRQGWKQEELATALGCGQPFISEIERATDPKIPGRSWMTRIWRLTRGEVAPNDFYDLPPIGQRELPLDPSAGPLFDGAQDAADAEPERLVA